MSPENRKEEQNSVLRKKRSVGRQEPFMEGENIPFQTPQNRLRI